jgi:hypothetical protein
MLCITHTKPNMSNTISDFDSYRRAAEINDQWDNYSSIITYQSRTMTLMVLMETLQEILTRYPFAKDYKINHIKLDGEIFSTSIEIDMVNGTITIS